MGNEELIYMVDDNTANLQAGRNILSKKYIVSIAPSADILFKLLENNIPALILLDVDMPGMSGYETIEILKSKPETKNIPVIFLTEQADTDNEFEWFSLGAIDYITKPFKPHLLRKRVESHLLIETQKKKLENFNDNLQKMVLEKTQNILDLQNALLKTMAELAECRDDITGGHVERTQRGVKILFEEIKKDNIYPEEIQGLDLELLLQSCQLHDIGKIYIDDSILRKSGKLTNEELLKMKEHTSLGEQLIKKIESLTKENDFLKYAKIFACSHHERWDGSGYHRGLKGDEIPILGRVMAIADVYDALTSERPYKKAFSHEEAVNIIFNGKGRQFDPVLVDLFMKVNNKFLE